MARRERPGNYRLVKLVTVSEHESIKEIEDIFHFQSKFYTHLEKYAVYRQDKRGNWCAWLDPSDLARLVEGKLNTDWDDDLEFGEEAEE